jgi:alpha-glucosidase
VCTVNLTSEPVTVPAPGRVLMTSGAEVAAGAAGEGTARIAADTAVWWAI